MARRRPSFIIRLTSVSYLGNTLLHETTTCARVRAVLFGVRRCVDRTDNDNRSPHPRTIGRQPLEQRFARESRRFRAPFGGDECFGAAHFRGQFFQFIDGERLFDEMANRKRLADFLREKLPRFDAAGSTGFPEQFDFGHAIFSTRSRGSGPHQI